MAKPQQSADTVTPLDGDGKNVVQPGEGAPTVETGNVNPEDYNTEGRTTVATPRGYRFASSNKEIPVVTSAGIKVTAEQADALAKESDGLVFKVEKKDEE